MEAIDNIEIVFLQNEDYSDIKTVMVEAYANMPEAYWKESHISALIKNFQKDR